MSAKGIFPSMAIETFGAYLFQCALLRSLLVETHLGNPLRQVTEVASMMDI